MIYFFKTQLEFDRFLTDIKQNVFKGSKPIWIQNFFFPYLFSEKMFPIKHTKFGLKYPYLNVSYCIRCLILPHVLRRRDYISVLSRLHILVF